MEKVNILLAFILGLVFLYLAGRIVYVPLKYILRLVINGIVGGIMLLIINVGGSFFNLTIPINPVTALVAGILGIPGVCLLIILHYLVL